MPKNILKLNHSNIPPWNLKQPKLNLSLIFFQKKNSHPQIYLRSHAEFLNKHKNFTVVFTDGSNINEKTAAAIIFGNITSTYRLPDITSIYTADAFAILQATQQMLMSEVQNLIVHCDSLNVIQAIQNPYNRHPMIKNIQDNLHHSINTGKNITIVWIPSHIGIQGNEDVDAAAKTAVQQEEIQHRCTLN